jgi:hypothetical protein
MPAPGFFDLDNFDLEALLDQQEPTLTPEAGDESPPSSFRLTVLPGGKGQGRRSTATEGSSHGENGVDTIPPTARPSAP